MKFRVLIEKFYYRFYKYCIAGKNSQCFHMGENSNPKQVIFYLADHKIVHLGDTLWFEPIARFLSVYFTVAICPNKAMEFYFSQLNYEITNIDNINDESAVIVAPIELMFKLRHLKNVLFLSFDYRNVEPGNKLINSMITAIAKHFNLNSNLVNGKYQALSFKHEQVIENLNKFSLQQDKTYILFNNYIDSWGKYTTQEMVHKSVKILIKYAENYKNENKEVKLIHTGSSIDKDKDNILLDDLIDIDLRGKTTVEDLFLLVQSPQITQYIGFDTFLLHLFNIYEKPSHILLRPGNSEETNQKIKDAVLVPYFSAQDPLLVLINHD